MVAWEVRKIPSRRSERYPPGGYSNSNATNNNNSNRNGNRNAIEIDSNRNAIEIDGTRNAMVRNTSNLSQCSVEAQQPRSSPKQSNCNRMQMKLAISKE